MDSLEKGRQYLIELDSLYNLATIRVNGRDAGTIWTPPYKLDITENLRPGKNSIEILVTNTWRNRLIFEEINPAEKKTWFNSPYSLKNKPLLPSGIIGEVKMLIR